MFGLNEIAFRGLPYVTVSRLEKKVHLSLFLALSPPSPAPHHALSVSTPTPCFQLALTAEFRSVLLEGRRQATSNFVSSPTSTTMSGTNTYDPESLAPGNLNDTDRNSHLSPQGTKSLQDANSCKLFPPTLAPDSCLCEIYFSFLLFPDLFPGADTNFGLGLSLWSLKSLGQQEPYRRYSWYLTGLWAVRTSVRFHVRCCTFF